MTLLGALILSVSCLNSVFVEIKSDPVERITVLGDLFPCGISRPQQRIAKGTDAKKHEFPWLVSLTGFNEHICGGSVIHPRWILTAGFCVNRIERFNLKVIAGVHSLKAPEYTQQIRSVELIILSTNYNSLPRENDIALLKLHKSLYFNGNTVAPICLPDAYQKFDATNAIYAGWDNNENALKKITVPIITRDQCKSALKSAGVLYPVNQYQVCTKSDVNGGPCNKDIGGPAMIVQKRRYMAWGIFSWVEKCGRPKYPNINTEVASYINWIRGTIKNY